MLHLAIAGFAASVLLHCEIRLVLYRVTSVYSVQETCTMFYGSQAPCDRPPACFLFDGMTDD